MFETELSKLLRQNETAAQTDLEYIAKDNELAHNVINEILKSLIERVVKLEEYISTEITSPSNIRYRPDGVEEYLTLKENLDLIYQRLNNSERT
jgi:hypothetical protein